MVKFRIVQGSSKKLGKFPSKYIVADFYEGLCRCRFSVSPVTGNAVSSMYASRESMVLSMVGHLFQNYDTRYVRFSPRILAIIPATRYTCVFLSRILAFFPALWGFYSQVYDHFLTNAHIYAHQKAHICVTNKHVVYAVTESRRIRGTELYRQ